MIPDGPRILRRISIDAPDGVRLHFVALAQYVALNLLEMYAISDNVVDR